MYIDFNKFNYNTIPDNDKERYESRDKEAYKAVLNEWFSSNIDDYVQRKWEIEEIQYLKEIGDFIKLIKEAESLYELGFYTGCIALVGISAEDFSKYLSINNGRDAHLTFVRRNGSTYDVSQYNRLQLQLEENIINRSTYDELDKIRGIRNDCLHYNSNFKQKSQADLKTEALISLNSLKNVLKNTIGTMPDPNDFNQIFDNLVQENNNRGIEEIIWKQKNMLSHLLNFPITQDPDISEVYKWNTYEVLDIDDSEIDLQELQVHPILNTRLFVIVDLNKTTSALINSQNIEIGDNVFATLQSEVAEDGQTRYWFIKNIVKL